MNNNVYLRHNVLAEPLVNQWYTWSYLLSPATAAMYIANSHVQVMQSFIAAPQTHIAALKNPAMVGGPFINYDAGKVPAVKALLERTLREQRHMLEFATAVKALDDILAGEADGYGLEPLYRKIPDVLRGYVELVYDLNNNPSIRFVEGLLYPSRYYDESSQQVALSLIHKDGRSFVFSTPRLGDDGELRINKCLKDEGLDELFKMKSRPQPYGRIAEILGVPEGDELFQTFFNEQEPPPSPSFTGDGVRIRYFGHACVLIETQGIRILTDPLISYKYGAGDDRYTYADLPEQIDYILITHNHQDHCLFESLLQLRHKTRNVVVPRSVGGSLADPSLKLLLRQVGFKNVREIDELETIEVEGGAIVGLPFFGEHGDLNIRTKSAYLITINGRSILCAADSNNIEPQLYKNIHDVIGNVDLLFLGMECVGGPLSWLYGPLMTRPLLRKMDQSRRFDGSNYERAIGIVDLLNPKQVYVYAMGQEPWLTFLTSLHYHDDAYQIVESNRLITDCRSRGLISERLYCRKEIVLDDVIATS